MPRWPRNDPQARGPIAAFGELIQDIVVTIAQDIAYGGGQIDGDIELTSGGCAANVTAGCARMDVPSRFLGHSGSDPIGDRLVDQLEGLGVQVLGPHRGRTASSLCIATSDNETALVFSPGDARTVRPADFGLATVQDLSILHINSHHIYAEETRETVFHLAQLCQRSGIRLSLDVSAGNRLQSYGVGRYLDDLRSLQPTILLANEHEAEILDLAQRTPDGVGLTVTHRGAGSTLVRDGAGRGSVVAVDPVDDVINTTGAGDAFAAGLLSGWWLGESAEEAVQRAHRLAATTIVHHGARIDTRTPTSTSNPASCR